MMSDLRSKARERLSARLEPFYPVERLMTPPRGWIRALRDALGMTGVQLGERLNVSAQSVDALERSEAAGTIKLDTLRRAAEALDCHLVYALVPRKPLEQMVRDRARVLASRDLDRVAHTMKLEAQETGDDDREQRLDDYIRDHVRLRDIWKDR